MNIVRGVLAAAILMASGDLALAQQKRDLFGFTTKMTFEEVVTTAKAKGYSCASNPDDPSGFACRTPTGKLDFIFTAYLPRRLVHDISTSFATGENADDLENSIIAQYKLRKSEVWATQNGKKMFVWDLGDDTLLSLNTGDPARVSLFAPNLHREDQKAWKDRYRKNNPTPKF